MVTGDVIKGAKLKLLKVADDVTVAEPYRLPSWFNTSTVQLMMRALTGAPFF